MNNQWLAIKQLDQQLNEWKIVSKKFGMPRVGWVKTLRLVLSMTAGQLAERLGLTRSRIVQLENAEIHDAVTLRTLREAANAMECELVYAIVPKNKGGLEAIIKTRAQQVAIDRITRVAHSMSLEAQSVEAGALKKQKEELVDSLMRHLNKKFWILLESQKNKDEALSDAMQENRYKKLLENLKKKKHL